MLLLGDCTNEFDDPDSEYYELRDIVGSYDVSDRNMYIYHDMNKEHTLCARVE